MNRLVKKLKNGWKFCIDPEKNGLSEKWQYTGLPNGRYVSIPHTWNIEKGSEEYRGLAWYEFKFTAPLLWENKRIRVKFKGVYRDADIWLNGIKIDSHYNSGYTPFTLDISDAVKIGESNRLTVAVDNSYSVKSLPYRRSFDWADDGGIYRDVLLIISERNAFDLVRVYAQPLVQENGLRVDIAKASFRADICLLTRNDQTANSLTLEWKLFKGCDENLELEEKGAVPVVDKTNVQIPETILRNVYLWHFDCPQLYTLQLILKGKDSIQDMFKTTIGFRKFKVVKNRFYLNGEAVRLSGTEWMPGSCPDYGMAETPEQIQRMLLLLKESNCVFTRFHWQQDDTVYDWCDRNGMLVQEEIPFWGKDPAVAGEDQLKCLKEQALEMVGAHFNHPSIFAWGVGNELDGQAADTIAYVKSAVKYVKKLDPYRPVDYVSNTLLRGYNTDATTLGDIMMLNDYIGTWTGDLDQMGELRNVISANPDKPLVPSEFGLCEPAFSGGDVSRIRIFLDKMSAYRNFPSIAGTINFCLNDYRTQMGEDGIGRLRKRIHGSIDMSFNLKPSYFVVQRECAPFLAELYHADGNSCLLRITSRKDLPCYTIKGYSFKLRNKKGAGLQDIPIPTLHPGESFSITIQVPEKSEYIGTVCRPNSNIALLIPLHF